MTTTQPARARLFRSLHTPAAPLALANAWDVASARVIEAAGAPAIATTSAGVAWSLGSPDGDALARDQALELISRITAAVAVPVTADIEGGYGQDAADVAETVTGVLAAGAAGVNIEDGTRAPDELATRLAVARRTADRTGADLFLNARIDTYLLGLGDPDTRLEETLSRARLYVDAGADGIFVPGTTDTATIAALAEGISVPLNVMAGPGAPGVAELGALGVARVSLGPGVAQAAYAAARRAARELFDTGGYESLAGGMTFPELNALLSESR
ncbi:3-methyl-2-oxobutanoate hydroxymethyltransferase [Streptomyces sp. NTH33]|uniref:isocitrate lyase/PEP mutase family protein n=1 Tax=Streptomyces sp. NTH33 TaxID=1735453 RepID=UPI000DA8B631|nr:isocitrate lyase/phosphoenolpyruvate mutase family protein [Streptomyces sp. NTH33]PZH07930.1 3-methyl-2-oxobutanoate hydroxymethyltransferase [Streptomyces sp. NTH33]